MAECRFALLCETALLQDKDLVSILGGGVTQWDLAGLPGVLSVCVVAEVAWTPAEFDQTHVLAVSVTDGLGDTISLDHWSVVMQGPSQPALGFASTKLVKDLVFDVRRSGRYEVAISSDGVVLSRLPLWVSSELPPV